MRDRYGGWARWSIWVLVAILMIVIANVVLILLRPVSALPYSMLAFQPFSRLVVVVIGPINLGDANPDDR